MRRDGIVEEPVLHHHLGLHETRLRPFQGGQIVPGTIVANTNTTFDPPVGDIGKPCLMFCLATETEETLHEDIQSARNIKRSKIVVYTWELTDVTAKVVIYDYDAFVEGRLEAPKHLARIVHDLYFEPKYEDFRPRTIWSLSNAFTSAFKELDPIPQFRATAKPGEFLEARFSQAF